MNDRDGDPERRKSPAMSIKYGFSRTFPPEVTSPLPGKMMKKIFPVSIALRPCLWLAACGGFFVLSAVPGLADSLRLEMPEAERSILEPLLQRHLVLTAPRDAVEREALETRLKREGRDLLEIEGYFDPRLTLSGPPDALVLTVEPGERTLVESIQIHVDGPLSDDRRRALENAWPLKAGQPFRQTDWEEAKERLLLDLMERDFPAARLTTSEALVDADRHRAALTLSLESGPPYRFGILHVEGLSRYSPSLVARYNTGLTPGAPYSEAILRDLQSTLENTPYFSTVLVKPDLAASEAQPDGSRMAPVTVSLREEAPHRVGLGAGISSNTGLRLEANFETADFLNRAWQFSSGLRLEQRKQSLYADVFLPPSQHSDPTQRYRYAFGLLLENSDIQDLRLKTASFGVNRQQEWRGIDLTLSLGYLAEQQNPWHRPKEHTRALTVNSIWNWYTPYTEGARVATQLQVGSALKPISSQNFIRFYGRQHVTFHLNRQHTLNLRAEGGIVLADSRRGIPQNFLFRAGGSNSVRGYAYQSLGVKEGNATLGGRYLVTVSGELIHWLSGTPWGIALFADAGNANDDKKAFHLQTGYGIGARWNSPAGPLGIDLAYGDQWRLHFAFSIPF